jgi:hypothetical protein
MDASSVLSDWFFPEKTLDHVEVAGIMRGFVGKADAVL